MPPRKATELTDLIKKLRTIRRQHVNALEEIEKTFRTFGLQHLIDSGKPAKRAAAAPAPAKGKKKAAGRPKAKAAAPKAAPAPKGKKAGRKAKKASAKPANKSASKSRGKYEVTGDEFILRFIAKKGSATTSEIRQFWTKQGRKGKAENNLTGLVKSGKLNRTPTPGQAGSTYAVPSSTPTPSA